MLQCEACGSINIARMRSSRFDKVVRFFTGHKRFGCRRCGWTALRRWDERALEVKEPSAKPRLVSDRDSEG